MKQYFFVDELNGTLQVRYNTFDGLPFGKVLGSYNVFKARLFNLPYNEYLIMTRNNYGAYLKGQTGYMIEYFEIEDKEKAKIFCKELNRRINLALKAWEERK